MNFFYWNIRGIGNSDTRVTLRNLFLSHKPLLLFIAEPMITIDKVPAWFWKSIGVRNFSVNDSGLLIPNLWALWGNEVNPTIIFLSSQCIALEVIYMQYTFYIAAIYAVHRTCPVRISEQTLLTFKVDTMGLGYLLETLMLFSVLMRSAVVGLRLLCRVRIFCSGVTLIC